MARKRVRQIISGILLLIPVALIVGACAYMLKIDTVLQIWLWNILRVFASAIFAIVLYFLLTVTFTNLSEASKLVFGSHTEKKE